MASESQDFRRVSFRELICDEGAFRGPQTAKRPPLRSLPGLIISNDHIITCLSSGLGYDLDSVENKLSEGNESFNNNDHSKALHAYGVAYQIYRLMPNPFRPLAHDLVVRRVLCLSYLGRLDEALTECEVALTIVPKAPTTLLLHGLLSYRTGSVIQANESFQKCMRQDPDLKDVAELIVAAMMQASGRSEDAIEMASKVLRRADSVFARIVRGDCYKFHPKGCFGGEAAEDYSTALMVDPSVVSLLGQGFAPAAARGHLERLLLRFHPGLWRDGPRALKEYELSKSNSFKYVAFVGLVFLCVAKLKRFVHNSRQRRKEEEERAELEARQSTLQGRMQQLCEAARLSESSCNKDMNRHYKEAALVNGWPEFQKARAARPKSAHDYRRVWKERPQDFPRRHPTSGRSKSPSRKIAEFGASRKFIECGVSKNSTGAINDHWHRCTPEQPAKTAGLDPGREVCGFFERDNNQYYQYCVQYYCAPDTSAALGLLDYSREVRGLPDICVAPDFEPLWEHHRDVTHHDLSAHSKFPLEVPGPPVPQPKKQLPRGVRDFIQGDPHLKGLVKKEGFV